MKSIWNRRPVILGMAAAGLVVSLTVGSAMAYFTTYSTASGSVTIHMGFTETEIEEEVDEDGKHICIRNTGDYDCFARVMVIAVEDVTYSAEAGWEYGEDGYWYYEPVLPAGESTSLLNVGYEFPADEDGVEAFDIVVVQECTPVLYEEDGTPYADWENGIPAIEEN